MQSRFFILRLEPYTYEQFYEIIVRLLNSSHYNVDEEMARAISDSVWNTTQNIRDCVRLATMAKSVEDVKWLVKSFVNKENG